MCFPDPFVPYCSIPPEWAPAHHLWGFHLLVTSSLIAGKGRRVEDGSQVMVTQAGHAPRIELFSCFGDPLLAADPISDRHCQRFVNTEQGEPAVVACDGPGARLVRIFQPIEFFTGDDLLRQEGADRFGEGKAGPAGGLQFHAQVPHRDLKVTEHPAPERRFVNRISIALAF